MLHKLYCHSCRLCLQQLWKNIRTVQKIALILASLQTTHPCMTRRHSFFSTSLAHPRTNVLQTNVLQTTAPKATLPRTNDSSFKRPIHERPFLKFFISYERPFLETSFPRCNQFFKLSNNPCN